MDIWDFTSCLEDKNMKLVDMNSSGSLALQRQNMKRIQQKHLGLFLLNDGKVSQTFKNIGNTFRTGKL